MPFGLVAGASPVAQDLGGWTAIGFSTIVFAGASQLAAADVLADGGSALVATLAACTINLRMLLYSASIARLMAHESLPRRLGVAYLLVDQAFALSVARFGEGNRDDRPQRLPYYLGIGVTMWTAWQLATITGVLIGAAVPESVPLDFAVPMVFLVLLVPMLASRPAVVAAAVGGAAAVAVAEMGGERLAVMVGALAGIAAGAVADAAGASRAARHPPPGEEP